MLNTLQFEISEHDRLRDFYRHWLLFIHQKSFMYFSKCNIFNVSITVAIQKRIWMKLKCNPLPPPPPAVPTLSFCRKAVFESGDYFNGEVLLLLHLSRLPSHENHVCTFKSKWNLIIETVSIDNMDEIYVPRITSIFVVKQYSEESTAFSWKSCLYFLK